MAKRRLTGRQLRFLFARGVLRSKGSGKNRRVEYNKSANATSTRSLGRNAKRKGLSAGGKNVNNKFPRTVIGGSKAAGLRSGSAPARRIPSKAERDATREGRLTRSYERLAEFAGKKSTTVLRRANEADPVPARKIMQSKFPGSFKDTGERFPAGAKIHYGDGPSGKGAYSRRAGVKDFADDFTGRGGLSNVAGFTRPGRAATQRTAFNSSSITVLREFSQSRGGLERRVDGRRVIDRIPSLGPLVDRPNKKRGVKAHLGKRVRDATRALLREAKAGR